VLFRSLLPLPCHQQTLLIRSWVHQLLSHTLPHTKPLSSCLHNRDCIARVKVCRLVVPYHTRFWQTFTILTKTDCLLYKFIMSLQSDILLNRKQLNSELQNAAASFFTFRFRSSRHWSAYWDNMHLLKPCCDAGMTSEKGHPHNISRKCFLRYWL